MYIKQEPDICTRTLLTMIKRAESDVRLFVFGQYSKATVDLRERYLLSGQYSINQLMHIYKDSIMDELRERSQVEYNLVKRAKYTIEGNSLIYQIEEGTLARNKKGRRRFREIYRFAAGKAVQLLLFYHRQAYLSMAKGIFSSHSGRRTCRLTHKICKKRFILRRLRLTFPENYAKLIFNGISQKSDSAIFS